MFSHGKIGTRLAGGFALLLLIFAAAGWYAWKNLNNVREQAASLEEQYVPGITLSSEVEKVTHDLMLNVRSYVLGNSFSDLDAAHANFIYIDGLLEKGGGARCEVPRSRPSAGRNGEGEDPDLPLCSPP